MVKRCTRCGASETVFVSSDSPSLNSAMRRFCGLRIPIFEPIVTYKCDKCGEVFETRNGL